MQIMIFAALLLLSAGVSIFLHLAQDGLMSFETHLPNGCCAKLACLRVLEESQLLILAANSQLELIQVVRDNTTNVLVTG